MSNPLSWDDLRLFLSIVRAGTLTGAAREQRSSQPTLGRRLRDIEARAGQPLVLRSGGRFVPTDAGRAAIDVATRMEAEALALERRLQSTGQAVEGLLRLSSSEWFARHVLTPRLVAFRADHPRVTIELLADTRLLDLDRREADMVFRFRRFEESGIVQRFFARIDYGVFAAPALARSLGPSIDPNIALITMDTAQAGLVDVDWLTDRLPRRAIGFRSNSRDIQAQACAAGGGLAVLPVAVGAAYGLVEVDVGEAPPHRDVWLGYHADLRAHPAVRLLVGHLTG